MCVPNMQQTFFLAILWTIQYNSHLHCVGHVKVFKCWLKDMEECNRIFTNTPWASENFGSHRGSKSNPLWIQRDDCISNLQVRKKKRTFKKFLRIFHLCWFPLHRLTTPTGARLKSSLKAMRVSIVSGPLQDSST